MRTLYLRKMTISAAAAIGLLLALFFYTPAVPARADEAEPAGSPADVTAPVSPTATLPATDVVPAAAPDVAAEPFVEEDLGPAGAPIDDTAALTDTILPALADYLAREKSMSPEADVAAAYGTDIPERAKAASRGVFLPLVSGTNPQSQPGPVEPPPSDEPKKGGDVTAVIWPEPSIRVARGGTLTYEIRLYNDGEASAKSTTVTLPFDGGQLTPIGSRLDRGAGDWVSDVRSNAIVVSFGELDNKEQRSGFITFRVGAALLDNTVLSVRPAYRWSDARGTHDRSGNWAPVLVGGGNDTGTYVWTIVQPADGRPGELRTFYSNRFAPGETVTAWLNTPSGVVSLSITETADEQGQVWLDYRPSRLAPGSYQMVVHGNKSRLTGVATFTVW